jgi:hypothetical protein
VEQNTAHHVSAQRRGSADQATSSGDATFRNYVLAVLRCAQLRARLAQLDIETAGIALRADMISPEAALDWLYQGEALDYLDEPPPPNEAPR